MSVIHYYSRKGCHLCELMLEDLLPLIRDRVDLEFRDIDSEPEWREKYDVRVPVVEFDGQIISEYPLDDEAIREMLRKMPENRQ